MQKGIDYIGVSAGAIIFNDKGEIFLSKRSQNTSNERGHWETPGGSVEFGETLEQAAKREILEELDALPAPLSIITKMDLEQYYKRQ
jgi:mutator protein MutT